MAAMKFLRDTPPIWPTAGPAGIADCHTPFSISWKGWAPQRPVSFRRISLDYKLKAFLAAAGRPQPLAHFGWQEMFNPTRNRGYSAPPFCPNS
jgi:hypothetical protein